MSVASSFACGATPSLPKQIRKDVLEELTSQTLLKPAEVKALYARFRRLAPAGHLLPEQFRQTMGVLGVTDDPFLPDRMFKVFDTNQDGKLTFFEFASSLAVMIRGTEDEKLKLSFQVAAGRREASGILLDDFQRLVRACNTMMSSLVAPLKAMMPDEEIRRLFHDLASGVSSDEGEAMITLDAYKVAAQHNDDFLAILGLETRPRYPARSNTRMSTTGSVYSAMPGNLGNLGNLGTGPTSPPRNFGTPVPAATPEHPPQGQTLIAVSQIEELRNKINLLRRTALQQRLAPAPPTATGPPLPPPPSMLPPVLEDDDTDERRWWSSFCNCSPPAPKPARICVDGCAPTKPPPQAVPAQCSLALDDLCGELDGILGWCNQVCPGPGEARNQVGGSSASNAPAPGPAGPPLQSPRTAGASQHGSIRSQEAVSTIFTSGSRITSVRVPTHGRSRSSSRVEGNQRHHTITGALAAGLHRARTRHRLLGPKKGLAVHFGHENWNMVLSMMVGIRMSVGRSQHEVTRELQPCDFIMKEKFSIIPRLANIFDSAVSKNVQVTRFIDYAPMVFQKIRSTFGIQHDDYLRSVGPEQLLGNMVLGNLSSLSELSSEGKSGAFFYYTADGQYMMKTVSEKEFVLLNKMLKKYYDHITQNPETLIVRFLGLHCLRLKTAKQGLQSLVSPTQQLYFVVMGNMFNTPFEINRRYDLKGSWVGRSTPSEHFDPGVALKDVDFKEANEAIRIGEERKAKLVAQIESDSAFLRDNNIIDYSLLVGIHDVGAVSTRPSVLSCNGIDFPESDLLALACPSSPGITGLVASPADQPAPTPEPPLRAPLGLRGSTFALPEAKVAMHQRDLGGMLSSDRKCLYFVGIIDILTPYDSAKRAEHLVKGLRHDWRGVSCCPPAFYAERFSAFMRNAIV